MSDDQGPKFSPEEATRRKEIEARTGQKIKLVNPLGSGGDVAKIARMTEEIQELSAEPGATSETVDQGRIADLPADVLRELARIRKTAKEQGIRGGIDI